jgi:hypothetical protein
MTDIAPIGHNKPPTPMEECAAAFDSTISEAQNWGDGEAVDSEAQMNAVDVLIKDIKSYRSALTKAGKEYTDPAHKAWKGMVAEVKVYSDDGDIMQAALVAAVAPFKAKLAEQREAERQAAWQAAREAERAAEALAATANAANIEEARAADAARHAAMDAKKIASAAQKNNVPGMRKVTKHEILTMRGLVNWIATDDKAAMAAFATEYARKTHADIPNNIVRTWTEKAAY